MLQFAVLASGSTGNCSIVCRNGTAILIDAGISAKRLLAAVAASGIDPGQISAVIVTHEHSDHVKGLQPILRKLHVPLYATSGTLQHLPLGNNGEFDIRPFRAGDVFDIAGIKVKTLPVPHDAEEPVALLFENNGTQLGLAQDLGFVSQLLISRLRNCCALIFESNHDVEMLKQGPYPWSVKQRIMSRHGHLSNEESCSALLRILNARSRQLVFGHLSQTNNHPRLVRQNGDGLRERFGQQLEVRIALPDVPTPLIPVEND